MKITFLKVCSKRQFVFWKFYYGIQIWLSGIWFFASRIIWCRSRAFYTFHWADMAQEANVLVLLHEFVLLALRSFFFFITNWTKFILGMEMWQEAQLFLIFYVSLHCLEASFSCRPTLSFLLCSTSKAIKLYFSEICYFLSDNLSCRFVSQVNATLALLHPINCTRERKVHVVFDMTTIPAFVIVLGCLYMVLRPRRPKPKINWGF